jgi:uncharacterized membrane protein
MIEFDITLLADMIALLAITRGRSEARVVVETILGALIGALVAFFLAKEQSDSTAVRLVALVSGALVGGIIGLFFGLPRSRYLLR